MYEVESLDSLLALLGQCSSIYCQVDVFHRIDWIELNEEIHPVINGKVDKNISLSLIISRYKEAKYHIENKILPKRDFKKSSKACQYCNYKDYCWKGRTNG